MDWKLLIAKLSSFWLLQSRKRKTTIILFVAAILLFLVLVFVQKLFITSSEETISQDKSWQMSIAYNAKTKTILLKKLTILPIRTTLDDRTATFSPYTIEVTNAHGDMLYRQHFHIDEQMHVDFISHIATGAEPILPETIYTNVLVPYTSEGKTISVKRNGKQVLLIHLPQKLSFSFPQQTLAATPLSDISCGPLQVVFVNDNYPDVNQFRTDVQSLTSIYNSTPPYNVSPSIFDFKEIDDPQNYNCSNDLYACWTAHVNIYNDTVSSPYIVAKSRFPDAKKVIVLSNSTQPDIGRIGGITGGAGGNIVMYSNYAYPNTIKFSSATHEFLGHSVGYLYDRYVINEQFAQSKGIYYYGQILPGDPRSNCTTNASGEPGWPEGGHQGCANHTNYGPYPLVCDFSSVPASQRVTDNGGTHDTVMSAPDCTKTNQFDPVEQNWIRTRVVSMYQTACPTATANPSPSPSPNPSPSLSSSPSVSASPTATIHTLHVTVFLDKNNNHLQDSGETGYPDATVGIAGTFPETLVTDANGNADFGGIPEGNYTIQVHLQGTVSQPEPFPVDSSSPAIIPVGIGVYIPPVPTAIPGSTITPTAPPPQIGGVVYLTPTPGAPVTTAPPALPTDSSQTNSSDTSSDTGDQPQEPLVAYNCVPDPQCNSGKTNIQLCTLVCNPAPVTTQPPEIPTVMTQPPTVVTQPPTQQPTIPYTPVTTQPPTSSPPPEIACCPGWTLIGTNGCQRCCGDEPQACSSIDILHQSGYILSGMVSTCAGNPNGIACVGKPVIYLYPEKTTDVAVTIHTTGNIVVSDPFYPSSGWQHIEAHPDGTFIYHNKTYSELFYEAEVNTIPQPKSGIIIPLNKLGLTLARLTTQFGLKESERNEFLTYWLPRLQNLHANYILFSLINSDEKERIDHVEINPKPDTFIELLAYFKPLAYPIAIDPLSIPEKIPQRNKFTAVEWGATIDAKNSITLY